MAEPGPVLFNEESSCQDCCVNPADIDTSQCKRTAQQITSSLFIVSFIISLIFILLKYQFLVYNVRKTMMFS